MTRVYGLTEKQLQVADLISRGFTIIQAADNLGKSPHTVKSTVTRVMQKTGAVNMTEAVATLLRDGDLT